MFTLRILVQIASKRSVLYGKDVAIGSVVEISIAFLQVLVETEMRSGLF